MLPLLARSRSIAAIPDEASVRMSTTTRSGAAPSADRAFDDADRHTAGAQQLRDLAFEFVVVADDLRCELSHGSLLNQTNRFRERRRSAPGRRFPCGARRSA